LTAAWIANRSLSTGTGVVIEETAIAGPGAMAVILPRIAQAGKTGGRMRKRSRSPDRLVCTRMEYRRPRLEKAIDHKKEEL